MQHVRTETMSDQVVINPPAAPNGTPMDDRYRSRKWIGHLLAAASINVWSGVILVLSYLVARVSPDAWPPALWVVAAVIILGNIAAWGGYGIVNVADSLVKLRHGGQG